MGSRVPLPLALVLAWVAVWEPLAPASRRTTWRDQWRADLWHYWTWLSRHEPSRPRAALALFARASACVPHAIALRLTEWSLFMLMSDVRFAWRMLVRRPAFTTVAVLILGLGIGANATIFSWVESVLLRPLPGVAGQDRLVALRGTMPDRTNLSFSYPNFTDLRNARPDGLEDVIAFRAAAMNLRAGGEPIRVWGELVTPNFFDVLGVPIANGRGFLPSDAAAPGREPVAVLSDGCWRRVFGADPSAIGRAITLNGRAFTVVGVAPEGFRGSVAALSLDVFVPITMQQAVMEGDRLAQRGSAFLQVFGRLAPGATIAQAQASASVVAARLAEAYPESNRDRGILAVPLWRDGASGILLPIMATLMGVVGVVLLIACANLAGLMLARATGRQREVAVRLAVGASRGRLVRQFLVESLLLAAAGGVAGVVLSYWTSGLLNAFIPRTPFPVNLDAGVSGTVLAFSVAVTLVTALAFGLLPAVRASRPDVGTALKDAAASVTPNAGRGRLRQALVVSQVALSLVLLVCAALFLRSLERAHAIDPGYTLRDGLLASIDLLPNGYDAARGAAFYRELLRRLDAVPGVEAATVAAAVPLELGPSGSDMSVDVDGYQPRPGEAVQAYYNRVAPRYFETMGVPIVRGRALDERDVEGAALAVVVNETMARRYWGARDPIGGRIEFGSGPAVVVGIAKNGKYGQLNEAPRSYMYLSIYQYFRPDVILHVRTAGNPAAVLPAVRVELERLDPNLPMFDVRTVEEHRRMSVFMPRMAGLLLGLFGLLALLLALVGLYSVISYSVGQRTHEIGVRVALGASRGEITRMVLRQGIRVTALGLVIGLALAAGAAQVLAGQLMGLPPLDPLSFVVMTALLGAVATAAAAIPARRAARLDPLRALRHD
jgi:predicted permease